MQLDHARLSGRDRILFWVWRWVSQFAEPVTLARAIVELPGFLRSWREYRKLLGAEPARLIDIYPQLHDRTATHNLDAHYFFMNAWAMRRIVQTHPEGHVDIGSQPSLVAALSAVVPTTFVEYRPLPVDLPNLECKEGDILALPYADGSISSLSCLHVAEHIGLGRYGDPLNPHGTRLAAVELARVLAVKGNLFFAVPVGRPRLCFNAHRVHSASTIVEYFSDLELVEFSAVNDDHTYVENVSPAAYDAAEYACGLFWFRRLSEARPSAAEI